MAFDVLYVEDDAKFWTTEFSDALSHYPHALNVERVASPEEARERLDLRFDVVLADVYFKDGDGHERDRLGDIIEVVRAWELTDRGRPLPIIAYTGRGPDALRDCLARRESLYDIWDKNSATADYVAWRLAHLATELSRRRPDSELQRLVRGMPSGASWHGHVVEMARRYGQGTSELDQVVQASGAILDIAHDLGVHEQAKAMWAAMTDWESLSRAVSPRMRGHTRHVINVFWLGYYLIHCPVLRDWFCSAWERVVEDRPKALEIKGLSPVEALSSAWFFAAIFHDVGGCIEKASLVGEHLVRVTRTFGGFAPRIQIDQEDSLTSFREAGATFCVGFDPPLRTEVRTAIERSAKTGRPDQGIVAALHFNEILATGPMGYCAREAGRAASLHNVFPELGDGASILPVYWENDPVVCLLLLCDQIQTWDRERGDQTLWDDSPQRAQLSRLLVGSDASGRPEIVMDIDYIAPGHVTRAPEIFVREKLKLKATLRDHPSRALRRIHHPWPFSVRVNCHFNGEPLELAIAMPTKAPTG